MTIKNVQLIAAFVLVSILGLLFVFPFFGKPNVAVNAQQETSGTKWEYAAFDLEGQYKYSVRDVVGEATIDFSNEQGYSTENVSVKISKDNLDRRKLEALLVAKAMHTLGDSGWELVSQGTSLGNSSIDQRILYFKRPKQ